MKNHDYCSIAGLKHRGWTTKAIELFLGEPDKTDVNPHYRSAAPTKLYHLGRVIDAEKSQAYMDFMKANAGRVEASKRAVDTKKAKLMKYIEDCKITVKQKSYEDVVKEAVEAHNEFKAEIAFERSLRGQETDYQEATIDDEPEFLERIVVNYLRHQFTRYEKELAAIFGKVGTREAYVALNQKIYIEIARVYPNLKGECEKQLAKKMGLPPADIQSQGIIPEKKEQTRQTTLI
ncbi:Uncharacterised protein [uncultured archaeon]|nr:Uncharacterised protein [uncultured archaeon]